VDNEILGMVQRAVRGIEVTEDTIAQDVILRVGPAGNYLAEEHTVAHMRSEFVFPSLSDREKREQWEACGSPSVQQRANERAREILAEHQPAPLAAAQEAQIRAELPGII
jgi:trimethylamine--corrinoid protein Co-methyltransferase